MSYFKMRQQERNVPLRRFQKKKTNIHKPLNIKTIKTSNSLFEKQCSAILR